MSTSIGLWNFLKRIGANDLGGFSEGDVNLLLHASPVRGTEFSIVNWMDIEPLKRRVIFLTGDQHNGLAGFRDNLFAVGWTGDGFGVFLDSLELPAGMEGDCVRVHPDGDFVAVAGSGASWHVYPWDGSGFGTVVTQAKPATSISRNCAWSHDGNFLAFTDNRNQATTPDFCHVYPWDDVSGFGARITGPAAGEQNEDGTDTVEWAPVDSHILFGDDGAGIATSTQPIRCWNWNKGGGGSFGTLVTPPDFGFLNDDGMNDQSQFGGRDIAFHPQGLYVALMHVLDNPTATGRDALPFAVFPWTGVSMSAPFGTRVPSPPDTLNNDNISQQALAWSPDGRQLTLGRRQTSGDSEFIRTYHFDPGTGLFGVEGVDHVTYVDGDHNRVALDSLPRPQGIINLHTGINPGGIEDLFFPNQISDPIEQQRLMAMASQGDYGGSSFDPDTDEFWAQTYAMVLGYAPGGLRGPGGSPGLGGEDFCQHREEFEEIIDPAGNSFLLTDGIKKFMRVESGLGMPPIRYITQRAPFQHGEELIDFQLEPRVLQKRVRANAISRNDWWDLRQFFLNALRPNRQVSPGQPVQALIYRQHLPDGVHRDLRVMTDGTPDMPQRQRRGWDEWSIDDVVRLIAHDPVWSDPVTKTLTLLTDDDQLTFGDGVAFQGGADFEPGERIYFGGGLAASLVYVGSWEAFPRIVLTGPISNPTISNDATQQMISLSYIVAAGEEITFDLTPGIKSVISGTAGSLTGSLDPTGDLATWSIVPDPTAVAGVNPIRLTGADIDLVAGTALRLTWDDRYIGI